MTMGGQPIESLLVQLGVRIENIEGKIAASMRGAERAASDGEARISTIYRQGSLRLSSYGQNAANASMAIVAPLALLATAAAGFGAASVKMAGDMEQSKIAFTQLLGSAEKAEIFLKNLFDFAAKTHFEFVDLQAPARTFLAFGVQAESIIPVMTALGDAVAGVGGGQVEIARVTRAMTQMLSLGRLSAEEMNQLAEVLPGPWQILADQLGITMAEAREKSEKGLISGATAVQALLTGMGQKFKGQMVAQSTTLNGMFSTVKDNVTGIMISIGSAISEALNIKGNLGGLLEGLAQLNILVKEKGLGGAFKEMFSTAQQQMILAFAGAVMGALVPAFLAIGGAVVGLMVALAPFMIAGAAIVLIGQQIFGSWENALATFGTLKDTILSLVEPLTRIRTEGLAAVRDFITGIVEVFSGSQGEVQGQVGQWATAFVEWVKPVAAQVIAELGNLINDLFNWTMAQVPGWINVLGSWGLAFVQWLGPMLPPLFAALYSMAGDILDWITANAPRLLETFISQWVPAAIGWVAQAAAAIAPELPKILAAIGEWIITEGVPALGRLAWNLGAAIIKGILVGALNVVAQVGGALLSVINRLFDPIRAALGIAQQGGGISESDFNTDGGIGAGVLAAKYEALAKRQEEVAATAISMGDAEAKAAADIAAAAAAADALANAFTGGGGINIPGAGAPVASKAGGGSGGAGGGAAAAIEDIRSALQRITDQKAFDVWLDGLSKFLAETGDLEHVLAQFESIGFTAEETAREVLSMLSDIEREAKATADRAAEELKRMAAGMFDAITASFGRGGTFQEGLADFANQEWITSLGEKIKAQLEAGLTPDPVLLSTYESALANSLERQRALAEDNAQKMEQINQNMVAQMVKDLEYKGDQEYKENQRQADIKQGLEVSQMMALDRYEQQVRAEKEQKEKDHQDRLKQIKEMPNTIAQRINDEIAKRSFSGQAFSIKDAIKIATGAFGNGIVNMLAGMPGSYIRPKDGKGNAQLQASIDSARTFFQGLGFNQAGLRGLLSLDTGGVVPGSLGAPRLAIVHGGERVIPTGGDQVTALLTKLVGLEEAGRIIVMDKKAVGGIVSNEVMSTSTTRQRMGASGF